MPHRTIRRVLRQADREIARAERVLEHATRAMYQAGCRCLRCRAAEAQYRQQLRGLIARGQLPRGRRVPAGWVWRRVRALEAEGYSREQIAAALGLQSRTLQVDHRRVTVALQLSIERFYRWAQGD